MIHNNPIDSHIGQKLKEIRMLMRLSQEQVGELIGVSFQQIQKYEMGTNRISASRLYEFAQVFQKPISIFFDGYVADEEFHNIEFKSEEDRRQIDEEMNEEISKLASAFNRINSYEVRNNVIVLLNSIAECN
jgi:transcriptional regulator with XRE-family HTH domain